MKRLRVLVLLHQDLMPPEDGAVTFPRTGAEAWETEADVLGALRCLGHDVLPLPIGDEVAPIRQAVRAWRPDVVFNLIEAFHGEAIYDQHVAAYLELLRVPYTGCNPRGLTLSRDKALCKKVLTYHRVALPAFAVYARGKRVKRPRNLRFPLIVKSLVEEASLGIAQASVVDSDERLRARVQFIHDRIGTDAIAETYIAGRELYVGVMGNNRLTVLPTWELDMGKLAAAGRPVASYRVKWDPAYQKRQGIKWVAAQLPAAQELAVGALSKRIYRALNLTGYARFDYRLGMDGRFYLLEANPNPNIGMRDEFAASASAVGITYDALIQRIISLGVRG